MRLSITLSLWELWQRQTFTICSWTHSNVGCPENWLCFAGSLDRALCGVHDLISDDRMSIIDTEDMDMQIDYETFADMLLVKGGQGPANRQGSPSIVVIQRWQTGNLPLMNIQD
eukprot:CCRYP_011618-RD/>CCRYP_011618-RD protein AED:0.48 eAED:0.63 QI:0/0/0/1/0/0/2/0/113